MAFRDDHAIRYGKRGSSDILGITSDGRMLCVEVKTGKASQSPHQVNFQKSIEKFGGRYLIARSVDYVVNFLDDLCLPKIKL